MAILDDAKSNWVKKKIESKTMFILLIVGLLGLVLYDVYNYHSSTTSACEENNMKRIWTHEYSCIDSKGKIHDLEYTKDIFPKYYLVKE